MHIYIHQYLNLSQFNYLHLKINPKNVSHSVGRSVGLHTCVILSLHLPLAPGWKWS